MTSPRLEKIRQLLAERNEPDYRYRQICAALFGKYVPHYREITELPLSLREALSATLGDEVLTLRPVDTQESPEATKALFGLADGERVETVLLRGRQEDTTLCISSQVGCVCGCDFCATGAIGFKRNLNADEIADQALYFLQQGQRLHGLSLMGMGEPLLNPASFDALQMLADKKLFGMSQRSLNVSTVGVTPGIARITAELPQVNLAFSLHTPFSPERDRLVPLNRKYPLGEVMAALDRHIAATHRKVFIVYALFDGVNDTPGHAQALAALLRGRGEFGYLYHVNLMRYNPHTGGGGEYRTSETNLNTFRGLLEAAGVKVTVRHSPGAEIAAACGQLYAKYPQISR